MNAVLLHCAEGVQFRLGRTSLDRVSEIIHADTLFSGLTNIYAQAYGYDAASGFVDDVAQGAIRFSSGFYAVRRSWQPEEVLYFVPLPPVAFTDTEGDPSKRKKQKAIHYVSLGLWQAIGRTLKRDGDRFLSSTSLLEQPTIGKKFACLKGELTEDLSALTFVRTVTLPKVKVHTPVREDALYQETNMAFERAWHTKTQYLEGAFYFMLAQTLDDARLQRFMTCLRILADEGVGGSRSTGCGWFKAVEPVTIPLPNPPANLWMSLSPVVPKNDDEFRTAQRYDVLLRAGGSFGKANRLRLRMIAEGGLFNAPIEGDVPDVTPPNPPENTPPKRRNGTFFGLPFAQV